MKSPSNSEFILQINNVNYKFQTVIFSTGGATITVINPKNPTKRLFGFHINLELKTEWDREKQENNPIEWQIDWPTIGCSTVSETELFVALLNSGIRLAKELNDELLQTKN